MATFTNGEQDEHRKAFIDECKQKAWGAACNADWIGKQIDELLGNYQKSKNEDAALEEQIKTLDSAIDYHTKENREKRKAMQERRNGLAKSMQFMQQSVGEAQQAMTQLYANAEQNLALATHAEKWEWKETSSN